MSIANGLQSDYNSFVDSYGTTHYVFAVGSGELDQWGDLAAKHTGSAAFTGFVQEMSDDTSRNIQGDNINNSSVCYAKSGTTFSQGDKIEAHGNNYEVTTVLPKHVGSILVYTELVLSNIEP